MARWNGLTVNQNAFLDMLAYSEGTSTSKWTKDDGYDIIVDGIDSPHRFCSYKVHPNVKVQVNSKGLISTAAGRYQTLVRFARAYMQSLHLDSFDPIAQDQIALQQMREFRALPLIEAGQIQAAINAVYNLWVSLPGGLVQSKHDRTYEELIQIYTLKGGTVA